MALSVVAIPNAPNAERGMATTERAMTTNEFYFLILVCSAFVVLGVCLAIATVTYKQSLVRKVPTRIPSNPTAGAGTRRS